jgi:hypothetical protein
MAVAPSAEAQKLKTRDHALPESGTWPWHRQQTLISSKLEITHYLRAGHGHGTVSVRLLANSRMTYQLLDMKVANKVHFCVSRAIGVTVRG